MFNSKTEKSKYSYIFESLIVDKINLQTSVKKNERKLVLK